MCRLSEICVQLTKTFAGEVPLNQNVLHGFACNQSVWSACKMFTNNSNDENLRFYLKFMHSLNLSVE